VTERQVADLHVHTTASDGSLTPEQVVQEAAEAGLAAIGIADHDTVDGIAPGLAAGREAGIIVVPAVEINTDYNDEEVHLLGYYIDFESSTLNEHLERLRNARLERAEKMVKRLNELGLKISLDRVLEIAGAGSVGRPHVAKAMVEAGYSSSMNSAFGKYLVSGASAYIPRYKLTPFEAIEIIHEAGGVAVLAHPGDSRHDEMIPQLVDAGMQGIEVYHTDHSSAQARRYLQIAEKYNLIPTGGSDSHGPNMIKTIPVGHITVGMEVVRRLKELADGRN